MEQTAIPYDEIDPGIRELCRLINDSGLGETQFSCEGHCKSERPGNTDPYVSVMVLDYARWMDFLTRFLHPETPLVGLPEHLRYEAKLEQLGGDMFCTIWACLRYPVNFEYCRTPETEANRRAALQRTREHLYQSLSAYLSG